MTDGHVADLRQRSELLVLDGERGVLLGKVSGQAESLGQRLGNHRGTLGLLQRLPAGDDLVPQRDRIAGDEGEDEDEDE